MKTAFNIIALIIIVSLINTNITIAQEFSGSISGDAWMFLNSPLFPIQKRNNFSLGIELELYKKYESGSSFIFTPFVRLDAADPERTHYDIRELNYLYIADSWELRVGFDKVFWGSVEFVHLIDIINQTDAVESLDHEDKLGQPMIHFSLPRDWGTLDFFVLLYFRERTFPGSRGRLRTPIAVETDQARFESSWKEKNIDLSVRCSHTFDDVDLGIYQFIGTNREPIILQELDGNNQHVLIPYYEKIYQTGFDLQWVKGEWLFKMEALYRSGQGKDFFAAISGFDYTFYGVAESDLDLTIIGQWAYDSRANDSTSPYENDAMFGLRLGFNDPAGTEILSGVIQDLNTPAKALILEASRRYVSNLKASIESWFFLNSPEYNNFYFIRDDDFLKFELTYYF